MDPALELGADELVDVVVGAGESHRNGYTLAVYLIVGVSAAATSDSPPP